MSSGKIIARLRRVVGQFDGAFVSTGFVRLSSSVTGLIVAYAIVTYLTPKQQGYWYTFLSLLAIAAFAELGAGQILLRFVAHEVGHEGKAISPRAELRVRDLFAFCLKWGGVVSVVSALLALPLGLFWLGFRQADPGFDWTGPWTLAAFATIPVLFLGFLNSFFEGWQKVAAANVSRLATTWVTVGVVFASFALGAGLWGFGLSRIAGAAIGMLLTVGLHVPLIRRHRLFHPAPGTFDWKREFLPLQTRFALTWVTGILVNGIYAPVIFTFAGAEAAGRFGLTLSVVAVLGGLASALIGARQAGMAAMAGKPDIPGLERMSRFVMRFSVAAYAFGAAVLMAILYAGPSLLDRYTSRLLPPVDVLLAIGAAFFWLLITIYTTVVRSFNEEPFVRLAWMHAVGTVVIVIPAVQWFGATGAIVVSLVGNAVSAFFCRRYARRSLLKAARLFSDGR